jgi:type II secretory pathway component PulF
MNPITNKSNSLQFFYSSFSKNEETGINKSSSDSVEFSDTSKAFAKLDSFLNLGKRDRLDLSDLNESEKSEFLKMLATLLQKGFVGYEVLEVNGKPEKHYIVNQIGDQRINGAKLYKKKSYY